jgi:hypothetical protein
MEGTNSEIHLPQDKTIFLPKNYSLLDILTHAYYFLFEVSETPVIENFYFIVTFLKDNKAFFKQFK